MMGKMGEMGAWREAGRVPVPPGLPRRIVRACFAGETLYVLSDESEVFSWRGDGAEPIPGVVAVDLASQGRLLLRVDPEGRVFEWDPMEGLQRRLPISGRVEAVFAGGYGALFVAEGGRLWARGTMPPIGIDADLPKPVDFFEGREIRAAAVGDDFAAVIARKAHRDEVFLTPEPQEPPPRSESTEGASPPIDDASTTASSPSSAASASKGPGTPEPEPEPPPPPVRPPASVFANAEAARQFLTRQLSWVSAGEDYLAECAERPTRIIKENVSNLTSLVVEGVRTVGGSLSRHMSGGSDGDGDPEAPDAPAGPRTDPPEPRPEGPPRTPGAAVEAGRRLLAAEVWTWGGHERGQLGGGDRIARTRPIPIPRLAGIGALRISCGGSHAAALTLDGRAFLWGKNSRRQADASSAEDVSGPRKFDVRSPADRIRDAVCGEDHSLLLTLDGNVHYQGRIGDGAAETPINLKGSVEPSPDGGGPNAPSNILASKNFSYYRGDARPANGSSPAQDLAIEQQFLEETLTVHQCLIKTLMKKTVSFGPLAKYYETLCNDFADIVHFTAVNVLSFRRLADFDGKISETALLQNCDEHLSLYRNYLDSLCNILSIGGFNQISSNVDASGVLFNLFQDKLPTNVKKNNKKGSEAIISCALLHPLSRANVYKCMLQSILRYDFISSMGESLNRRLSDVLSKWDSFTEEYEKKKKEAEATKIFWDTSGKTAESFRIPERRLICESKTRPLTLHNSGRFSSHWFILFDDQFVHINGSAQNVHKLSTLWIDPVVDGDALKNAIQLTTPEEVFNVVAPTSEERNEWLQKLQNAVKSHLNRAFGDQVPLVRTAAYTFTSKSQLYKDATYVGRWKCGKMHGAGKMEWPDGRMYHGHFHNNQMHGSGKMEMPNIGIYEGQWKDNLQNGFGIMKYCSGDVYEGYFKDGLAHGYGVRKQGDFTSAAATVYMGDWVQGVRQGYGVMDDIGKGEKYLGTWNDNKKNGCGIIVTLDGIYYEGVFSNDVLMGYGIMIFEDGTHYEGEFKSAGVFSGKGTLTFSSGDKIEGTLNGAWNDGLKVNNAVLHMNVSNPSLTPDSKPNSFGKLCILPYQKWNGLFRQCFQQIGVPDYLLTPVGNHLLNFKSIINNKKVWQNIAVILSSTDNDQTIGLIKCDAFRKNSSHKFSAEKLNVIPTFGQTTLTDESYKDVKLYLIKACELSIHPLARLIIGCCAAFCTSYGGVRVHPLLLSHAVSELRYLISRLYSVIKILFPALPTPDISIESNDDKDGSILENYFESSDMVTVSNVVQPLVLPRVHSALHVLYALNHQQDDVTYWKRLLKWNRQTDITLMAFLGIDQKFWVNYTMSPIKDELFSEAIDTLQQLKTTFLPMEKLLVIKRTFEKMTSIVKKDLGEDYLCTMDEIFPLFHFIVVRARILQLGSEIQFIEDFMEPYMENGELGIMLTTLKACYYQILQEKNCEL